jgi:hypothetical protein
MQRMKVYSAGLWIWLLLCCSNSLMVMSLPWQRQRMRPVGVMVPRLYSLAVMPLDRFLCVCGGGAGYRREGCVLTREVQPGDAREPAASSGSWVVVC